jgi:hypothetical protein
VKAKKERAKNLVKKDKEGRKVIRVITKMVIITKTGMLNLAREIKGMKERMERLAMAVKEA